MTKPLPGHTTLHLAGIKVVRLLHIRSYITHQLVAYDVTSTDDACLLIGH